MIVSIPIIQGLKDTPNSAYDLLKTQFLYHSNKLEGSTFTEANLEKYLADSIVEGSHDIGDIYEIINSTKLFDFIMNTLGEPISKRLLLEFHQMLKRNTIDQERGMAGCWKKIPNRILGSDLVLAQPWEVDQKIDDLLNGWQASTKTLDDILHFHVNFEHIHPFQDGNGRIGRFVMLKQCIENNVALIIIDEKYSSQYKAALKKAQLTSDYTELHDIILCCQKQADEKLGFLKDTIEYMQDKG